MNEYPLFVPFESEHLAVVLTAPEGKPEGLVLLLAGTGAPRSHRFQMWSRTARSLAEHGLASIRIDYRGIGDSTGRLLQPILGDRRLDQAVAVAEVGMEITATQRIAVIGNCSGAIVALGLAGRMPQCEAAICIIPRLVQLGGVNRAAIGARKSKLAGFVRRSPPLRRLVTGTLKRTRDKPADPVRASFGPALDHADVLFVYSHRDPDPYVEKSKRLLSQMAADLSPDRRRRLEMVVTDAGPLAGFESMHAQDETINRSVEWVAQHFNGRSPKEIPPQALAEDTP